MTTYLELDLPTLDTPATHGEPALSQALSVINRSSEEAWGREYIKVMDRARITSLAIDRHVKHRLLAAFDDDATRCLGTAQLEIGITENRSLLTVMIYVIPEARRQGIGSELLKRARAIGKAEGCTTLQSWSEHPMQEISQEPEDLAALPITESEWTLQPAHPAVGFSTQHGIKAGLFEKVSALEIRNNQQLDNFLADAPNEAPEGYTVHTFLGPTPEHLRPASCSLLSSFVENIPLGELSFDNEVYTPERLAETEARFAVSKDELISTLVIHDATGEGAAVSGLFWNATAPQRIAQSITMSSPNHRGHRLGRLVKAANILAARKNWPEATRVYTDNADQNRPMLRINEDMGFTVVGASVGWQGKL